MQRVDWIVLEVQTGTIDRRGDEVSFCIIKALTLHLDNTRGVEKE